MKPVLRQAVNSMTAAPIRKAHARNDLSRAWRESRLLSVPLPVSGHARDASAVAYRGHSEPKIPPAISANIKPSMVERIVVPSERWYQIQPCQSAAEKPRNAVVAANRKTCM